MRVQALVAVLLLASACAHAPAQTAAPTARAATPDEQARVLSSLPSIKDERDCGQLTFGNFPNAVGFVSVRLIVTPAGKVSSAHVVHDTVADRKFPGQPTDFGRCIAERATRWRIDPLPGSPDPFQLDVSASIGHPATGEKDRELIRNAIRSHGDQIRSCFDAQLPAHPALAGKVIVRFVIGADGKVLSSSVVQSTVGVPDLEQCVAAQVTTFLFPRVLNGGTAVVLYPFVFRQAR